MSANNVCGVFIGQHGRKGAPHLATHATSRAFPSKMRVVAQAKHESAKEPVGELVAMNHVGMSIQRTVLWLL